MAIISSALPSGRNDVPPSLPATAPSLSASPSLDPCSVIRGKTTTVFKFFPVSCCNLKDPAHSLTQLAPRSSSKPSSRKADVTALAASASYFCLANLPAPVTNVIRIISEIGRGSLKAEVTFVVMVLTFCPARSNVSLSIQQGKPSRHYLSFGGQKEEQIDIGEVAFSLFLFSAKTAYL